jgi:transcriptional regulator with GAF, ATPase, and Fis domain
VPRLNERPEDIPLLVRYFVAKFATRSGKTVDTIPNTAMNSLLAYEWPGNVRELENLIERAVILTSGSELEFGDWLRGSLTGPDSSQDLDLDDVQKNHIVRVLRLTAGKVSGKGGAAELLGLKPTTLESRMKKLGIQRTR